MSGGSMEESMHRHLEPVFTAAERRPSGSFAAALAIRHTVFPRKFALIDGKRPAHPTSLDCEYRLAEVGYKFSTLNGDQVNLLMGYDSMMERLCLRACFVAFAMIKPLLKTCPICSRSQVFCLLLTKDSIVPKTSKSFQPTYVIPVPSNTAIFKYKNPNPQYYRWLHQTFFLGRPRGRFGVSGEASVGCFLGRPRFFCTG